MANSMNLSENQITDKKSLPQMAHDILIIDDEADIRTLIAGILEDEGYQTHQANDSSSATKSFETRLPSVVCWTFGLKEVNWMEWSYWHSFKKNNLTLP